MRLAGIKQGGYFPYMPHIAEAIVSWFILPPAGTRGLLLDPWAGEGEIASILGRLLNCETWACERTFALSHPIYEDGLRKVPISPTILMLSGILFW